MKPQRYRKLPVTVLAMRYTEKSRSAIIAWLGDKVAHRAIDDDGAEFDLANLRIITLEGEHRADVGKCWIVQGVAGEFYPVRNDIFNRTYERAK